MLSERLLHKIDNHLYVGDFLKSICRKRTPLSFVLVLDSQQCVAFSRRHVLQVSFNVTCQSGGLRGSPFLHTWPRWCDPVQLATTPSSPEFFAMSLVDRDNRLFSRS